MFALGVKDLRNEFRPIYDRIHVANTTPNVKCEPAYFNIAIILKIYKLVKLVDTA